MGKMVRAYKSPMASAKGQQQRHKGGGKQRLQGKDRDPARWLHHSLKTIHKALKQAKNFEIRKITRRLAQLRTAADAQGKAGPEAVRKLEQQLAAAKQADLDKLSKQAAAKAGLIVTGSATDATATSGQQRLREADPTAAVPAAAQATSTAPAHNGALFGAAAPAVYQRLLSAAAVQRQVAQQLAEFKRKFGAEVGSTAGKTADAQQPSSKRHKTDGATCSGDAAVAVMAASMDSDAMSSEHTVDDDSVDLEAEYQQLQQLEQQQELVAPADDELDAATLAALDKLKARSRVFESETDLEDSGVITDTVDAGESDSDNASPSSELFSDSKQQQQHRGGQQQKKAAERKEQHSGVPPQQAAIEGSEATVAAAAAAVMYPGPPPDAPKQQQQQQLNKYQKLQARKRAKLEKLLKRGKRIGQRMRRQLYEKLYGMDANHLKVERHSSKRGDRVPGKLQQQQHTQGRSQLPLRDRQRHGAATKPHMEQREVPRHSRQLKHSMQQQELHPSWAARKQQQRQQVSNAIATAARKVVFGDDGETVQLTQHVQPAKLLQVTTQQLPPAKKQNPSTTQQVHRPRRPSNQQADVGASRGTGSNRSAEQLHPSWQAKRQQQVAILAQPTGKKMVFNDE